MHEKEVGGIFVQPSFAGIILIRSAGIISAIRQRRRTPVTKLICAAKLKLLGDLILNDVTFIFTARYKMKLLL